MSCVKCGSVNEVRVSNGFKNPENKGKKYFSCTKCRKFEWLTDEIPPMTVEQIKAKNNPMIVCNAMNNATNLVCSGQVTMKDFRPAFNRILKMLADTES